MLKGNSGEGRIGREGKRADVWGEVTENSGERGLVQGQTPWVKRGSLRWLGDPSERGGRLDRKEGILQFLYQMQGDKKSSNGGKEKICRK